MKFKANQACPAISAATPFFDKDTPINGLIDLPLKNGFSINQCDSIVRVGAGLTNQVEDIGTREYVVLLLCPAIAGSNVLSGVDSIVESGFSIYQTDEIDALSNFGNRLLF